MKECSNGYFCYIRIAVITTIHGLNLLLDSTENNSFTLKFSSTGPSSEPELPPLLHQEVQRALFLAQNKQVLPQVRDVDRLGNFFNLTAVASDFGNHNGNDLTLISWLPAVQYVNNLSSCLIFSSQRWKFELLFSTLIKNTKFWKWQMFNFYDIYKTRRPDLVLALMFPLNHSYLTISIKENRFCSNLWDHILLWSPDVKHHHVSSVMMSH